MKIEIEQSWIEGLIKAKDTAVKELATNNFSGFNYLCGYIDSMRLKSTPSITKV